MPSLDVLMTILKIAAVFISASFIIFWVGLVWWVAQDVLSRTSDKIILAAAVAMTAILGPVGALLYLIIRPRQTLQESMGQMMDREMMLHASSSAICPTCGHMAQADFVSCPHCGTQLKDQCPQCAKLVSVEWSHCPFCAAKLTPSRQATQVASSKDNDFSASAAGPAIIITETIMTQDDAEPAPKSAFDDASTDRTSLAILRDVWNSTRDNVTRRWPSASAGSGPSGMPVSSPSVVASQPADTFMSQPETEPKTAAKEGVRAATASDVAKRRQAAAAKRRAKSHRGNHS